MGLKRHLNFIRRRFKKIIRLIIFLISLNNLLKRRFILTVCNMLLFRC